MGILSVVVPIAVMLAGGAGIVAVVRKKGQRLCQQYNSFTRQTLEKNFSLEDFPVKPEFRVIHPMKAMKLIKILVSSESGSKLGRVNTLDATMMGFVKMFTLVIRPEYSYNLPIFSADIIFMGKRRIFILEIIDPAGEEDVNKKAYYTAMKSHQSSLEKFEASGTNSDWAEKYLADCSIHIKADEKDDNLLFDIYKSYLVGYLKMVQAASRLPDDRSERMEKGLNNYVGDLLGKGGPAVDVFKTLLGPDKQKEFVRTILFGM